MSREWKPGDAAIVNGARAVRADRVWHTTHGVLSDHNVAHVRPLVVLDPESLPMDDLLRALDRWHTWSSLVHEKAAIKALFDAITEQTAPGRPDEPLGLGAVVRDTKGNLWVRTYGTASESDYTCWKPRDSITRHPWTDIDVAADCVLSEGVTP